MPDTAVVDDPAGGAVPPEEPAADLARRVRAALAAMLDRQRVRLADIDRDLGPVCDAIGDFVLSGGKRLRPAFAYWGWRAAGGADCPQIVAAASSLEWLHACALAHDDVMDASDTRRGMPSLHRRFATAHGAAGWRGDSAEFGRAAAILIGDLCLIWADEALDSAGLTGEQLLRAQPVYDEMRTELMAGQYLDLLAQRSGEPSMARALQVARYKSARYTVERPLQFGAVLAGAGAALVATLRAYGEPLGEAFQLRDDLLGVYGDPAVTGKPAGDDLREGKRTVLVARALAAATAGQAAVIHRHLGDPSLDAAAVAVLRAVIAETGAPAAVERLIAERTDRALAALAGADLPADAAISLRELATAATVRTG